MMYRIEKIITQARLAGDDERLMRVLMLVEDYSLEFLLSIMLKQMFDYSSDGDFQRNLSFIKGLPHKDRLHLIEALERGFLSMNHAKPEVLH